VDSVNLIYDHLRTAAYEQTLDDLDVFRALDVDVSQIGFKPVTSH
jgi:hypothetical protein